MKRFFWLSCFFMLTYTGFASGFFDQTAFSDVKRIVLLRPTVGTFSLFHSLMEQGVITIEGDYEVVGVFHTGEKYDYAKTRKYIVEEKLENFFLHEITGKLEIENLYGKNACTEIFRKIVAHSDAMLFFGGSDIPPAVYGEKASLLTWPPDRFRHYVELSLFFHLLGGSQNLHFNPVLAENPDYIVRAFCLGMQTMNVATGGTMYQDIPSEIYGINSIEDVLALPADQIHRYYRDMLEEGEDIYHGTFHAIRFDPESYFCRTLGLSPETYPLVNSRHHQAIHDIGHNLSIEAWSMDKKIVEALSHTIYPNVLGVQFHPEDNRLYNKELRFRLTPSEKELCPLTKVLEKGNGLVMHYAFWKDFSRLVNAH